MSDDRPGGMMVADIRTRTEWLGRHVFPHEPALRAWLRFGRLGDADVDDIVQETYTRFVTMASVDHVDDPRRYMFRIAHNIVMDHMRLAKVVPLEVVADYDLQNVIADEPSPERAAIDRDELGRLAKAIARLPLRMRQVFVLRRVDGLTQREVARQMGIAEGTVEKHMARGAVLLTEYLRDGGNGTAEPSRARSGGLRRTYVKGDGPAN